MVSKEQCEICEQYVLESQGVYISRCCCLSDFICNGCLYIHSLATYYRKCVKVLWISKCKVRRTDMIMKIKKRIQCEAIITSGPFAGQRCGETDNLVKCSNVLVPGCDGYYCLIFHWHEHWDTHETH